MGGLPTNKAVNSFAVDPSNPKIMYVAMDGRLFGSADAGVTWKPLGKNLKDLAAVTVNPKKPGEIYTVTARGVIFRTVDGGIHWNRQ